jgi:hypothetical protein
MDILKKYNKMVDAKKKEGYKEEYLRLTDTMENTQMYKDALRRNPEFDTSTMIVYADDVREELEFMEYETSIDPLSLDEVHRMYARFRGDTYTAQTTVDLNPYELGQDSDIRRAMVQHVRSQLEEEIIMNIMTSAQTPQTRTAPRATQAFFYADDQLIGTMNIEED